jgi:hypothetical protein
MGVLDKLMTAANAIDSINEDDVKELIAFGVNTGAQIGAQVLIDRLIGATKDVRGKTVEASATTSETPSKDIANGAIQRPVNKK